MADGAGTVPAVPTDGVTANVPEPTMGQGIERSMTELGQAAERAARELGAAAGRAADQAAAKLGPTVDAASKSLDATARDVGIAANTVQQGCGQMAGGAWDAISSGDFGAAGDAIKAAAGTCSDSISASLMALFPWVN